MPIDLSKIAKKVSQAISEKDFNSALRLLNGIDPLKVPMQDYPAYFKWKIACKNYIYNCLIEDDVNSRLLSIQDNPKILAQAEQLLANGDAKTASILFEKSNELVPSFQALLGLARAHAQLRNLDSAKQIYDYLLKANHQSFAVHFYHCEFLAEFRFQNAKIELDEAMLKWPERKELSALKKKYFPEMEKKANTMMVPEMEKKANVTIPLEVLNPQLFPRFFQERRNIINALKDKYSVVAALDLPNVAPRRAKSSP